jgi:hypothetical protein
MTDMDPINPDSQPGEIDSSESIPGLYKQIRAQVNFFI